MGTAAANSSNPRASHSLLRQCFLAALAIAAATLLRALLDPLVEERVIFVTYFAAIAFAAWYGGVGLGIATAVVSYLVADYLFISPRWTIALFGTSPQAFSNVLAFVVVTSTILILTEVLTRANARSESEARRADAERKLLEVTLGSIGDAVIVINVERNITFMNGIAEALTGWKQGEVAGKQLEQAFRIVNEQTGQQAENPIDKVLQTGAVVGLANHTVLISKNGTHYPIDDSAAPILDEDGRVLGVVLVFRDVSEQRQAHQAVQKLAAIVEHSDDAVIGKNMSGVITSWNRAAERLYGHTAAEAIGQPISLIVPPDHREELVDIMRRLKQGERIDAWDTVRVRKDGSRVDVSLQISPIKNSEGEIVGASKVARDVSRRKRNEESLAFLADASQALASLSSREGAMQQVANLVVPFLADWCVIHSLDEGDMMQPVAWAHRQSSQEILLGDFLRRAPFPVDSESALALAFRQDQPQLIEHVGSGTLFAVDGEAADMIRHLDPGSVICVPLTIRGRAIGVMTFVVTPATRVYGRHDLHFAKELAGRVSIAIENSQLFQSVQDAVRQKDDFLAMLSHELRNPLSAISYATALGQLAEGSEQGEVFPVIERQVAHLTHLIDDLLDVARVTRHKINLKLEPVELATVIEHAAKAGRHLFDERQQQFLLDVSPQSMPLMVDVTRTEQVLVNLLTNAAKYTPPGGKITLSARPEADEAVVTVADNGIGIAPEMVPKVFDLFSQGERTLDRSEGGLGVGLTIVRKLVEMLGGTVAVTSPGVGQGAEFIVRLPLTDVPVPRPAPTSNGPHGAAAKPRLLVVDDNVDTARLSAMLLRGKGFEVAIAHDGETALEMARANRPDAMLLDIGLPRMNGYEVAQLLRSEGYAGKLIAVSGYGQSEDRRRSLDAGFNHHLVKPVDHEHLVTLLNGGETNG